MMQDWMSWHTGQVILDTLLILGASLLAYWLVRHFNRFTERIERGNGAWRGTVLRLAPLVRVLALGALLVTAAATLFRSSGPLLVVTVAAFSLAVGLASVDLLRNVLAGILLGIQRTHTTGDRVRVGNTEGRITYIGLRATTIELADGSVRDVPNREFVSNEVAKLNIAGVGTPVVVEVSLDSSADLNAAKRIARRAAAISKFASPRTKPTVLVSQHEVSRDVIWLEIHGAVSDGAFIGRYKTEVAELVIEGLGRKRHQRKNEPASV